MNDQTTGALGYLPLQPATRTVNRAQRNEVMTPPPEPFRVLSMTVTLQDPVGNGDRWLEVSFLDEGGGHFVEIKTCSIDDKAAFRLDPDELSRLAEWAGNNCKALDRE